MIECKIIIDNHLDFPIRTHIEDTGDKIVLHIYKADMSPKIVESRESSDALNSN